MRCRANCDSQGTRTRRAVLFDGATIIITAYDSTASRECLCMLLIRSARLLHISLIVACAGTHLLCLQDGLKPLSSVLSVMLHERLGYGGSSASCLCAACCLLYQPRIAAASSGPSAPAVARSELAL
jgi:hypothetical protein